MIIKVGTFNLNNLFSRFNFKGRIEAILAGDTGLSVTYTFDDPQDYTIRSFMGRLVKEKDEAATALIARRIMEMDADVLAVQEVEDLPALQHFNRDYLKGLYPFQALVEGNDPRLIDVGVLSKLPIGALTSWRFASHPAEPDSPIFSRDLLEVEILDPKRRKRLFTLFNTHLKSQYLAPNENPVTGKQRADLTRRQQAEVIERILIERTRPNSAFVLLGDMNDSPESDCLAPFVQSRTLELVNGLTGAQETRPPRRDDPPPPGPLWTHRYKASGQPARYELFDQIWLSQKLALRQTAAWIGRRTKLGGDGSDHDPAWVVLDL